MLAMRLSLQGSRLRDDLVETGRLIAMFVLLFVITGAFRQWQLVRLHHPSAVKGRLHSWRLRTIAVQQNYPVTIYSGYRPFVGSGRPVLGGHWSFAQRLVREKKLAQDLDEEFPRPSHRSQPNRSLVASRSRSTPWRRSRIARPGCPG